MIGKWEAFIYDKAGVFIAELQADTLSVVRKQNQIWTASITIDYNLLTRSMAAQGTTVDNLLRSGWRTVKITRDGVTIFKGILNEPTIDYSDTGVNVTLPFKSWLAYFEKRFTSNVYTYTDAGQIAWGIINTAQGITDGDIGVTAGTITATKHRDRTFDRDEIANAIIKMSADEVKDGFDFEISNDKIFTVAARLGSDKPAIVFDDISILTANLAYGVGLNIVTQSHQLGNGSGATQITAVKTAGSTYTNKWFLQEKYSSNTSVSEVSTLEDAADKELLLNQDDSTTLKLSVNNHVDPSSYDIGDAITVKILEVDALYRIKQKTFQVAQGNEVINLEFY